MENKIIRNEYQRLVRIAFSQCDPVGVVFYPQYLVMGSHLLEEWFYQSLRIDYAAMIAVRRIGVPIVKLECTFSRPARLGENLRLVLSLENISQRSITLNIQARAEHDVEDIRLSMRQVLVFVSFETGKAIVIPEDIRQALMDFYSMG